MRFSIAVLTTALAFGLGTSAALAEDAPGAKSDITIVGADTGDAAAGAKQEAPGAADQGSAMPDESGAGGAAAPSSPNASEQSAPKEGKLPSPNSSY